MKKEYKIKFVDNEADEVVTAYVDMTEEELRGYYHAVSLINGSTPHELSVEEEE